MPEIASLGDVHRRFGDRFSGMRLTHVELLHWPVWRHPLTYTTFENVAIDPLEEGLLLLVRAGLRQLGDVASLLGCSEEYANDMATRLASVGGKFSCIARAEGDSVVPLPGIAQVLESHQRQVPVQKQLILLRDAIFGNWLSYGTTTFQVTNSPNPEDGHFRWLAPVVAEVSNEKAAVEFAVSQLTETEIISTEFAESGLLEWVNLWLGCFQPDSGARGRFLLFNPGMEDAPLMELTSAFEQDLDRNPVKLYFTDGPFRAGDLFWEGLAERIRCHRKSEELEIHRLYLADAGKREEELLRKGSPKADDSPELAGSRNEDELARVRREVAEAQTTIAELEKQLSTAPRIDYLEASQHPAVLRDAIRNSRSLLILICPWIRVRVLRPLLPDLDAAVRRGVQVLIGYGMPSNPNHPDNSDEEALTELRKRQIEKKLWLVHLNTHEKVIIQDDSLFVNSSFNFLSYTGGDGRRESGTLQRGGVVYVRDKFLNAFPSHVRQHVQEVLGTRESATQTTLDA